MLDFLVRRYRSSVPWLLVLTFACLIITQQQQQSARSAGATPTSCKRGGKGGAAAGAGRASGPAASRAATLSARAHSAQCLQPPMRLAIYQGRWYHSEVFGTLIDHANECGHSLTIYYEEGHATSALPLYVALYPGVFTVREPQHFLAEQHGYDAVVFTTPDDIPDEGLQKRNAHRFIYTVHLLEPAYAKPWHVLRLHMSTLVAWPFVLPVYDGGDAVPGAAGRSKEIMMLGTLWDGDNYDIKQVYKLAELLKPHGWTLVAYTRHWGTDTPPPENMRLEMSKGTVEVRGQRRAARARREQAGTHSPPPHTPPPSPPQVFEYAKKVSFIIIWPSAKSWYLVDRLTGSLPFALSVGTPILTSTAFASVYGLHEGRGVVVAPDVQGLAEQVLGKGGEGMGTARHQALIDTMYAYREAVRGQNTRTLDALLSAVPGEGTQGQPLAMPNPMKRFYE